MLKISGDTIQTPGNCAPLTQSKHTSCLTHTKPEIYPIFLSLLNNEAPCNWTHHFRLKLDLFNSSISRGTSTTKLLVQNM